MPQFISILRASLLATFLGLPVLAQQAPPPATSSPIQNGRQQQPSRGETESRLQQQGVGAPSQERDRELQDLNALSRQLLPPGSPVPAPEAEQRSRPQR